MTADITNGSKSEIQDRLSGSGQSELDEFIYHISHDVRNSVRALREIPEWIEEDLAEAGNSIEGALATNLHFMKTHTNRLDLMLRDLLVYSRVGRMQTIRPVALDEIVDQILGSINVPARFRIENNVGPIRLRIGERDIATLLSALICNAIRHHDRTDGTIQISADKSGDVVCISVADDGPGIDPKFQEKIFDIMTTLQPRDEVEGSGMGLAIARKIAQTYGGDLFVLSAPPARGSRFIARLPNTTTQSPV